MPAIPGRACANTNQLNPIPVTAIFSLAESTAMPGV